MAEDETGEGIYFVFVYALDPASKRMTRHVIGIFEDVLSARRMERLYNARAKKLMKSKTSSNEPARDEAGRLIKAAAVRYRLPYVSPEFAEAIGE